MLLVRQCIINYNMPRERVREELERRVAMFDVLPPIVLRGLAFERKRVTTILS